MTRFEMLKALSYIIDDSEGNFGEPDIERAAYVLDELEKLGMLPPTRTCFSPPDGEYNLEGTYYPSNSWEPEDEKK